MHTSSEVKMIFELIVHVRDELVEGGILLLGYCIFVLCPDSANCVNNFAVHFNRERHETRVMLDDAAT